MLICCIKVKKAFTLIEVLASITVLVVLLLALVRLYGEASNAYNKGTTSIARSAAGRAAMDMITRDLEGAVIDRRLQFYTEKNTVDSETFGAGFDEFYFVTIEGDPDDGRSYQAVHYYVKVFTNIDAGAKYVGFRLMRATIDWATAKKRGIDILNPPSGLDWWGDLPNPGFEEAVADNIVRFDLYVYGCDERPVQTHENGWINNKGYYSSLENWEWGGNVLPPNTPPFYFDVYLQVTLDETMKKAGTVLLAGGAANDTLKEEARSLLYRDSSVLVRRVRPTMAAAQVAHPISY